MSDVDFEIKGIEEFQQKLEKIKKSIPDGEEQLLKKAGNKLRKKSKDRTPVGKSNKHLKDGYKLSNIEYESGNGMNIKMTNTSPHFHLIEKGHRKVTKSGKELGFVPGKHMVETSFKELEEELPRYIDKWMDKLLK